MAAKTIKEAIEMAICIGPAYSVQERLLSELRDYAAHRVMILGENASASDLFEEMFSKVPAFKPVHIKILCKKCDQVLVKDEDDMCPECAMDAASFKREVR